MQKIIAERRANWEMTLLSGLAVGDDPTGRMDDANLVITMILLLIAGHETTVNLITNDADLAALSGRNGAVARPPGTGPDRGRRGAALRTAGAVRYLASHLPTSRSAAGRSRAGRYPADPRHGNRIQSGSHLPTASIPIVSITSTSASAAAFTIAWVHRWPESRDRLHWPRWLASL